MVVIHVVKIPEKSVIHDFLREYILSHNLRGGIVLGIGGLEYAVIGYLNPVSRSYLTREIKSSETILEVAPMIGNYVVKRDGDVSIHIHVTLATPSGIHAGHLVKGVANPFIEAFLVEVDKDLEKEFTHR